MSSGGGNNDNGNGRGANGGGRGGDNGNNGAGRNGDRTSGGGGGGGGANANKAPAPERGANAASGVERASDSNNGNGNNNNGNNNNQNQPRFVDDRNSRIKYDKDWEADGRRKEFKETSHGTSTKGATATFKFNGDAVAVHATLPGSNKNGASLMSFSVDGGPPTIFKQPESKDTLFRERVFFKRVTPGDHQLTMTGVMDKGDGEFFVDFLAVTGTQTQPDRAAAPPNPSTAPAVPGQITPPTTTDTSDQSFDTPDPDDDGPLPTDIPLTTDSGFPAPPFPTLPPATFGADPAPGSPTGLESGSSTAQRSPAMSPVAIGVTVASLSLLLGIIITLLFFTRRRRQLKRKDLHLKFDEIMANREKYDFGPETSTQFSTVMPSMFTRASSVATSWRNTNPNFSVPRRAVPPLSPSNRDSIQQPPQSRISYTTSMSDSSYGSVITRDSQRRDSTRDSGFGSSIPSVDLPTIPENTPVSVGHSHGSASPGSGYGGRRGVSPLPPSRLRSSVAMSIETISERESEYDYEPNRRAPTDVPRSPRREQERQDSMIV